MKAIINASRFLVFSNIFIAICAVCFTAKTSLLLYGNNGSLYVNSLVFFSTLFLYGFHRVYHRSQMLPEERGEERHHWADEHKTFYYAEIIIALIASAVLMFYMPLRVWGLLIPPAVMGLGYSVPFIKTRSGWKRLRDISWLKIFWISLAYAWMTTFIPVAYYSPVYDLFKPDVLLIFARSFLFIFVLVIPFDIRDMEYDSKNGIKSIPVLLGADFALRLAMLLVIAFALLVLLQWQNFHLTKAAATALCISAFEVALVTPLAKRRRPDLFYPFAIETSMILHWALIYAAIVLY